ncbi:uncharacterized protein DSM5745_06723 [Aspergillus mulundensis]|uniref:Uncharacterized protein n=1 Tax=Aspergillus mulundensis TaxID=1810919 RepID=A0A3D8RSE2_9EURO|nr:hypothetical protein DSM5745_06723 [Aspergillus mulundensis]RDW76731.1 hypothetical protein DSM5745_06723 [Aspergillus mulundensis]
MPTNQPPFISWALVEQPTNPTDVPTRAQLMRRHGLIVSDETPDIITILLDIPRDEEKKEKNFILTVLRNMIEVVQMRLVTKEFANPHEAVDPRNSRAIVTAITDSPTPFAVYKDIHRALVSLRDSLAEKEARGEILEMDENWVYFEGCIRMQWVEGVVPLERHYNAPVSDPRWRDELGLSKMPG